MTSLVTSPRRLGLGFSDADVDLLVDLIDLDKNGTVEYEELTRACTLEELREGLLAWRGGAEADSEARPEQNLRLALCGAHS